MQNTCFHSHFYEEVHINGAAAVFSVWGLPTSEEVVWGRRRCYNQQIKQDIRCWNNWNTKIWQTKLNYFFFFPPTPPLCDKKRVKFKRDKVRSNKFLQSELSIVLDPVSKALFICFGAGRIKLKPIISMTCVATLPDCRTSKSPWFPLTEHVNWCLIDNSSSQAMACVA